MRTKLAAIVLVTVVICIGLFIVVDSALVEASATVARAPEEEWNRTFGGSGGDGASSVQQTTDGGYILVGVTSSYGAGSADSWLVKTNSAGNEEWSRTFGGSDSDYARSVQQTTDGGYILAGVTCSYGAGSADFWLVKTNSAGNEEWRRTFGGSDYDIAHSVQQTTDGGYILAGKTYSYGAGSADSWLVKTNSGGNEEWSRTFGGSDYDGASSVQQTTDGGYILVGTTSSYGAGSWDFWLVKTDSAGNEEWRRTFGGSDYDMAHSVQQTTDGGYILAGKTNSYGAGSADFWLVKTNSGGNEEWSRTFGGSDFDFAWSVQQTSDGGYIIVGITCSYGSGEEDVWLIKLEGTAQKAMKAEVLSPSNDFSVLKGSNVPLKVKMTYEGEPITGASLTASFSNGDPDLKLTDGENGIYTGTWTPTNIIEGQVESPAEITIEAYHGILGSVYAKVDGVIRTEMPLHIEDFGITPPTQSVPTNGPITAGINDNIRIWYLIKSTYTSNKDIKLITKIRNHDTGEIIPNPTNDKVVTLPPSDTGWYSYSRSFVIPSGTKAGTYDVLYSIYKPDQSDKYDETWKAGWLIVDTNTYTVSLRSSANDGSLNIGSIRVDTATYNLPSEVTKQYRMNEYYYVEAIPPMGYNFDKWETFGGVSVNDIGNAFGILSVTGAGTLNAVLKKAPTFEIILNPTSISLNPGEKGSTLVNVKSLNGFSGSVELTLGWDEASGNWFSNVNFDPKIVTMTSGEQVISELSFDLSSSATPGVYNMKVRASDSQCQCQSKYENLQLTVKGTTTQDPVLENWEITPTMAKAGNTVELHYYIYNPNSQSLEVTLGVTMRDSNGQEMVDKTNDIDVTVTPGRNWYKRSFVIDPNANIGYYDVMWGIHKAHLAGMYGNSGWQENRLEITTAKTLDDLLDAEQMLYKDVKKTINTQTRQVIADYALFDKAFNFEAADSAVEILLKTEYALIKVPLISKLMALHSIFAPLSGAHTAEQAYSEIMSNDAIYQDIYTKYKKEIMCSDSRLYIKDTENLNQIEESHEKFVDFINTYNTANMDHKTKEELAILLQEQIDLLNSNRFSVNNPGFETYQLGYHVPLSEMASQSGNILLVYNIVTVGTSVVACPIAMYIALGTAAPSGGFSLLGWTALCGATITLGSGVSQAVIEGDLNSKMLEHIIYEVNWHNKFSQKMVEIYDALLSTSINNLNPDNLDHLPIAKLLSVEASNINSGGITQLTLKLSNIGTKSIVADGYFEIYKDGEYLTTLETSPMVIRGGSTEDISASLVFPSSGEYTIYAYAIYENIRTEKLSKNILFSPVTGTIVVNTNNVNARFIIIGLNPFSGEGTSWSTNEAPIGTYKIIFDPIDGFDTPPSQELVLTPDSTITFTGDYIRQTITYSITLNSNRADIPLIVDGKVIYHDELPKTFTWSKNSEHTIKAQTEVNKDASTKYVFVKWDDGNTDSERTITVNSDKTYNAEYKTQYYLSLKTNPENIGTVFGAGWYDVNSPAEITSPVITGYAFTGWTVDDSTVVGNPILISMDSQHNAVANYVSTDTSLPIVTGNTPTGSDVPVNTPITITFSEAMNQEYTQSAFSTSPATIGCFSWSGNTMAYTSSSNLVSDTTYTVTVGTGAMDLTGNNLQSPYSWQFSTASIEPKLCTNTIGMEFVLIPAGEFAMGSPPDEEGRCYGEGPVHHVNIGKVFYIGKYEVTQKQWREIMGDNPSIFEGDDDLPVKKVSWDDVQEFIVKLNEKEGTDKYRLPSEAEWEYACRAGTATRYSFGDSESKLGDYAWYLGNLGGQTQPVGQKLPNPWGLYDMHGNVWEWMQDCGHIDYNGAPTDGSAWIVACKKYDGATRVIRGGGWGFIAWDCRSAARLCIDPRSRRSFLGFRLLREQ